ncbi:ATP-binding protein [Bacterioplanes sanyensis]|uniref:ATP-binding protein n=1 Tax=Bacterioplanes sanyensis TaxID=1249553 RepID=A0A222FI30_9GAMM|nr:AAA family ATPase [Bacterioplanes sanyensis]ASP38717.1 ATP-binding protein [Bacterioplanes sanyensis]
MLSTIAIANYRSLINLIMPLEPLNLVTGLNGSGKSNLYKSLRLLAETAQGGVVNALAREGGLESAFWAGPEKLSARMLSGEVEVQGGPRQQAYRLRMGFAAEDFGYCIDLGLPTPSNSAFALDPEIKRECIWAGPSYRPASVLVERKGPVVKVKEGRRWQVIAQHLNTFDSMLSEVADVQLAPEIFHIRETIRSWRFYDHFRSDANAPARQPHLGTRTPVLSQDGHDLAAALQTIIEIGDRQALAESIDDAFPGAQIQVDVQEDGRFVLRFYQHGLLRPLSAAELSDGTLRYLLWVAALLTPRPPTLMVLNEPETSLHPDLLPALGRLIKRAAANTQVWVVSHARLMINELSDSAQCNAIHLVKELGQTGIEDQGLLDAPSWHWP